MAVLQSIDSAFSQEMVKHEATHTQYGAPKRPYVYREFPQMIFLAEAHTGGPRICDMRTVDTADERANWESRGWHRTQEGAIQVVKDAAQALAVAAAELNFDTAKRNTKAKDEANRVIEASEGHIGEIPRTPIKPRGRPRKIALA